MHRYVAAFRRDVLVSSGTPAGGGRTLPRRGQCINALLRQSVSWEGESGVRLVGGRVMQARCARGAGGVACLRSSPAWRELGVSLKGAPLRSAWPSATSPLTLTPSSALRWIDRLRRDDPASISPKGCLALGRGLGGPRKPVERFGGLPRWSGWSGVPPSHRKRPKGDFAPLGHG